jgi:hypothetical protein
MDSFQEFLMLSCPHLYIHPSSFCFCFEQYRFFICTLDELVRQFCPWSLPDWKYLHNLTISMLLPMQVVMFGLFGLGSFCREES